jgi:hypothetical protein
MSVASAVTTIRSYGAPGWWPSAPSPVITRTPGYPARARFAAAWAASSPSYSMVTMVPSGPARQARSAALKPVAAPTSRIAFPGSAWSCSSMAATRFGLDAELIEVPSAARRVTTGLRL